MVWTLLGFVVTLSILCLMEAVSSRPHTQRKEAAA